MAKNPESRCGTIGWGILATGVLAWDVLAPETLSCAADRALDHKYMRYVAWGIGGVVTGHVMNLLPPKVDPIQKLADRMIG